MRELIFSFLLGSGEAEADALRLARSIRTFGGKYCFSPIWIMSPKAEQDLSETTRQALFSIGARLISFDPYPGQVRFPFLSYVTAAGIVEGLAQGETSYLVMMAPDTLMLREPVSFILPAGKSFGGSPVHLKLLGSGFDEPVNDFWGLIYKHCRVDVDRIFPMHTIVDGEPVRAYFNAGLLVVRPERGLLRGWQATFERIYPMPEFGPFYRQSELYEIFMHQAVLSGCLLSSLKPEEFQLFPMEVNYPLHLHSRMPKDRRPAELGQLVTCRYEEYAEVFNDPKLDAMIHIDPELKDWIKAQV